MSFIHSFGITHKDLKPENVLMCGNYKDLPSRWTARISDFGSATRCTEASDEEGWSKYFAAPEIFRGERIGPEADVYSFAMTVLDMICATNGLTLRGQWCNFVSYETVANGHRPNVPTVDLSGLAEIIKSCWASEPRNDLRLKM